MADGDHEPRRSGDGTAPPAQDASELDTPDAPDAPEAPEAGPAPAPTSRRPSIDVGPARPLRRADRLRVDDRSEARDEGDGSSLTSKLGWAAIAAGLAVMIVFAWRALREDDVPAPPSDLDDAPIPLDAAAAAPSQPPRCTEPDQPGLMVGEAPKARPQQPEPAPGDPEPEPDDELAPFAVEIGEATVFDGGFAAGTLRDAEGGTVAMVAFLGADGSGGKLVRLGRSRGDMEAPVVAGAGKSVLAAMVEPNAGGRAIKIARIHGDEVTWGPELSEGRDESLAVDVSVSGARALVAWDDVSKDHDRGTVLVASFDTETMRSVTTARPVTGEGIDADSPRLARRPGGWWLAYVARIETKVAEPKGKPKEQADDDESEARGGQTIEHAWLEVVPLDENAAPIGAAQRVTPRDGHVLAFDIEGGDDGSVLAAWRDDDTPTGSSGGTVSLARVAAGGGAANIQVIADEGVGTGVPSLLPGWVAVSGVSGAKRLAAMRADGTLIDALVPEAALGNAEPVAAREGKLLLVRHLGRAVKLTVASCAAGPAPPPAASVSGSAAPPPSAKP